MFGKKDFLDSELKLSYSKSGASHVLAVSGLHVGVIFVFLNFLFSLFIRGNKTGFRLARVSFVLVLLWSFAFLTGGSASVLRSALMFSFFQFAFLFQRPFYAYASLFSSMFLLIVWEPQLLFNVGFQLSYAAVLSFLFFQPKIAALFSPANKFLAWTWNLTSVSLAAQIGTAPLVLYYFHQFSFLFWLSALVVVPLATALIALTGLTLLTYPVSCVCDFFAFLLDKVAIAMNFCVESINHIPFSSASDLYCPLICVFMIFVAILWFALYCSIRRPFALILSLVSVLLMLSFSIFDYESKANKSTFAVYYLPGVSAVNAFSFSENVVMTDNLDKVSRKANDFWLASYAPATPVSDSVGVFSIGGRKAFVLSKVPEENFSYPECPVAVDYLVVSRNVKIEKDVLSRIFAYKRLIIDSSCSSSTAQWWLSRYHKGYVVMERGSFVEQF